MHIVHVLTRLLRGGSEENTIATCLWQAKAGHRVTLIHGRDFDPCWYGSHLPGVTLSELRDLVHPVHPVRDAQALRALRNRYRALRPDVVHTHQSKAGILGRIAASAVPGATVVHGAHIVPFAGAGFFRRNLYIAAERAAARHTDFLIAVSQDVARQYVEAGICPAEDAHCVYSGMQLDPFVDSSPPPDWRSLVGGVPSSPVVLMLAAFESRKRHIPFLRVFRDVLDKVPQTRLLLAGSGPQEAKVREAVQSLGLEDRVVFCGHRSDPAALLAMADVSVLTSEREGLPRVVVQSIAAGCPVVVSALPGIGEIVQHRVNGLITDADDLRANARGIAAVLSDGDLRKRLRAGARSTNVSRWSLEALGRETTDLYRMVS